LFTVQVPIDEDSEEAVLEGQTMSLQYIVTPLQHPISVLQKVHSHAPASPPLVASDEMPSLESAYRHPAPSQKLPTSKQPTSPAAPASASPVSSSSITPTPLSLNLVSYIPPHTFDQKKHPPPRGFPIYYVPSSRTVCKRTPLEEPGTNPSRGVLLHMVLDEGT